MKTKKFMNMNRTQRPYKTIDLPPLTDKQKRTLEEIDKLKNSEIDTSDSPECRENGGFYYIQSLKIERIKELRKNIDSSDIPEIKDFSRGHLRNCKQKSK